MDFYCGGTHYRWEDQGLPADRCIFSDFEVQAGQTPDHSDTCIRASASTWPSLGLRRSSSEHWHQGYGGEGQERGGPGYGLTSCTKQEARLEDLSQNFQTIWKFYHKHLDQRFLKCGLGSPDFPEILSGINKVKFFTVILTLFDVLLSLSQECTEEFPGLFEVFSQQTEHRSRSETTSVFY